MKHLDLLQNFEFFGANNEFYWPVILKAVDNSHQNIFRRRLSLFRRNKKIY